MAKAYKTNYFDPMGNAHTGYIIDGKTYKDPRGEERVEKGSIVETQAGNYTLTSIGGVKTDDLKDRAEATKNKIDSLRKSAREKNESRYNAQRYEIDSRKRKAEQEYETASKNEYLKSMESEKNLDQLLKLHGLNGGMAESHILKNRLSYENAINMLKENLDDKLFELDNELLKLRSETDYNIAEDTREYDKLYLEYLQKYDDDFSDFLKDEAKTNSQNFKEKYFSEKEDAKFEEEMAFQREKFEHQLEDDERNYNLNMKKLASSQKGNYNSDETEYKRKLEEAKIRADFGDFSLMAELYGWDDETLEKAEKAYIINGY